MLMDRIAAETSNPLGIAIADEEPGSGLIAEASRGAARWLVAGAAGIVAGVCLVAAFTFAYSGTKYRNQFPSDYSYAFGKDRPFAPSLAHTVTNGAYDPRLLAGSETCGASGCHTEIYSEWKTSAHRYAAMDPIFQGIQGVMAKQNGPESTRYRRALSCCLNPPHVSCGTSPQMILRRFLKPDQNFTKRDSFDQNRSVRCSVTQFAKSAGFRSPDAHFHCSS
jgi:hypothetical protein